MYFFRYYDKFNRFLVTILPFIGIFFIIIAMIAVWYWELSGREKYLYEEVVVLNKNINKGQEVELLNIKSKKIEKNNIIEDCIRDSSEIIGLQARHFIPADVQLHKSYFESSEILIKPTEFVVKIPSNWIESVPDSVRRKDRIVLIPYNGKNKRSPILETVALYVKDSSNREVVNVGNNERFNGSSKVDSIEIKATMDEFILIQQQIAKGFKFIILYTNNKKGGFNDGSKNLE